MDKMKYKTIIVGAGLSGLILANELISEGHLKEELLVVERNNRAGGLIKTTVEDGYITEWGPEGLRGGKPGTNKVFSLIDAKAMELPSTVPARYIVHKGKLRQVPHGIISAITSPLIPFFGKIRIFFEPFVKKKAEDETLKEFIIRRFGKGVYPLVDAVVSGIYGGTPEKLSVTHAFPFFKSAELSSGSVIIGSIKQLRKGKKNSANEQKPKEKSPFLVKPEGGMKEIVDGLVEKIEVKYDFEVTKVSKNNGNYIIKSDNAEHETDNLIIATGINGVSHIDLPEIDNIDTVDESLVSIVSLGFSSENIPSKYTGYGFLAPSNENTFVLGVLFTSQLFPNTAPKGQSLLRVYVGGINHLDRATMKDDELIENVLLDLEKLMGISQKPSYTSIQKHAPNGIPQITMGHQKILDWKERVESQNKNLFLSGIGWNSIACEALINESINLASDIKFSKEKEQ
ncbi:MAG: protoporphyrinogen oxidase [Candidatus Heimdallarchaeota archaeon]|nr:protoporphyrinogen oxidase [Candidatus Heimdallarchaeota archaeon]